ncbi:tyrosine-type recombinase/integrase [Parasedimentitalea psychrophila]
MRGPGKWTPPKQLPKGRTWESMRSEFELGISIFTTFWNGPIGRVAIENPDMNDLARDRMPSDLPSPQLVQPFWFGEPAYKSTGWYTRGLPELTETQRLQEPERDSDVWRRWNRVHRMSPGPERARLRSRSFPGMMNDPAPVAPGKDLAAAIRHYFASPKYTDLAQRTQKEYDKHIAYFQKKMTHLLPRNVERYHVISWHSAWAKKETPHAANYRLTVMKILMEHAKDMGLRTKEMENPAKGIKAIEYEKQDRKPWPQDKIEAYRRTAEDRSLLVIEMCIGTGQRIADVLKMKWGDIQDSGIVLPQNKTKKDLRVPLTSHLSIALSNTEKRSVFILTNYRATGPWSYPGASDGVMKIRLQIGAEAYDIHALRHTTATELCLAGADDETIAAVTLQSPQMVQHYTRTVRQKVHALRSKDFRD